MLSNPSVGSIVVNIRDISDRKESEKTIRHQALHDPLTNLPNRQEMSQRIDHALEIAKRHNRQLAVMFLDLDRFKNYNDNLGHAVGDTVLKVVATRLQASLRSEDSVARFGGDEFIVLIEDISAGIDAVSVAEKILKAVALPLQVGEHMLHPTVSIGIAVFPSDGTTREALKKHSDIALYRAKANGRNRFCLYDDSMQTYDTQKFNLENDLRLAISRKEIVLYYQPIVSLKNNKLVAFEALARWKHPTKGLLQAGDFIPLAEESGMILALGEEVLCMACGQFKTWQSEGLNGFRLAVNLSAQQFNEVDFISKLTTLLHDCNMPGRSLELEITESVAMLDLERTISNLKQLKKIGTRISIDDFGTGYSSLSYLKRFPVHNLKIDRSFVKHCITSEQDASIIRTIISMAHNLNMRVTAEGVETEQQQNFLASLGCNEAQGFLIHPPMPVEEVSLWIKNRNSQKEHLEKIAQALG